MSLGTSLKPLLAGIVTKSHFKWTDQLTFLSIHISKHLCIQFDALFSNFYKSFGLPYRVMRISRLGGNLKLVESLNKTQTGVTTFLPSG